MLLEMKDIVKVYGQVVANDHISFSLDKGEILAVVGENGAGKSTIMKVLYGMEKASFSGSHKRLPSLAPLALSYTA